jgi:Tetratricopeptide repeat
MKQHIRQPAAAVPLHQRAAIVFEQRMGAAHPDTANSLFHLAGAHQTLGQRAQALPPAQRSTAIRLKVLGPAHPDTLASQARLATLQAPAAEAVQ